MERGEKRTRSNGENLGGGEKKIALPSQKEDASEGTAREEGSIAARGGEGRETLDAI